METQPVTTSEEKKKRTRSPAYPFINLETAITRAKEFYDKEQRNPANVSVAVKHWGFVDNSSSGLQTIAALSQFGLLQDSGVGDKRTVKLSQEALRIILDTRPDSEERLRLIKQAALSPSIHRQLWDKWVGDLPSDAQIRHTLLFDWQTPFNDRAVDGFIEEFRETIAFAKLEGSDKVVSEVKGNEGADPGNYVPKVGDYVQWESGGVLQFQEPKRISSFSPEGTYAFVDGTSTGLPVAELTLQEKHKPAGDSFVPSLPPKKTMRQDIFSLAEGTVSIQWPTPLSAESIEDLKDWLKIVERKISRSLISAEEQSQQ